jgi:hypothetical protein
MDSRTSCFRHRRSRERALRRHYRWARAPHPQAGSVLLVLWRPFGHDVKQLGRSRCRRALAPWRAAPARVRQRPACAARPPASGARSTARSTSCEASRAHTRRFVTVLEASLEMAINNAAKVRLIVTVETRRDRCARQRGTAPGQVQRGLSRVADEGTDERTTGRSPAPRSHARPRLRPPRECRSRLVRRSSPSSPTTTHCRSC